MGIRSTQICVGVICAGIVLGAHGAWGQGAGFPDADGDGIEDVGDVCPSVPDPLQADADGDGDGDLCECGDAQSDGRITLLDWVTLARCNAALGSCGPLCDVTDDAVCDGADVSPLRRYLAADLAKRDLRCAQRPLPSVLPPDDAEEPTTHFPDPPTPGYSPDDPLVYGTDDFAQDPGPGPRRPAIGGTLANSGARFDFVDASTPTTSHAEIVHPFDDAIVVTAEGRWADVFLGPYLVRILASDAPPAGPTGPPPDVTLEAPTSALEDLRLTKTFQIAPDPGSGAPLFSVETVTLIDAASGTPLDQQGGMGLGYLPTTCDEIAFVEYTKSHPIAAGMPAVHFPEISDCSAARCVLALTGWLSAHNNAWRARQMIEYAASQDSYYRSFIWGQPGLKQNGLATTEQSSPEYWFGHYADYRFEAIRDGMGKLWDMMTTLESNGLTIDLYCPDQGSDPGNVCFTSAASAHNIVKSDVALCDPFFALEDGDGNPLTYWPRAHTVSHELMHHRSVDFTKDGANLYRGIADTHFHAHGNACVSTPETKKFYGRTNVDELATYLNLQQGNCKHREKAFGNNDTWAYFVTTIGDLVHRRIMWSWPAPAQPTPQPPNCGQPGLEGCQCADTTGFGEGSDPDGDYLIDTYCPDDDSMLSCAKTKFNASSTVGVCIDCDEFRGPGCECDGGRPCDKGECYGDDTFGGGGTGHCYVTPIPSWVCLADCERLFNDSEAYCYHDAIGGARCYDSFCSEPEAEACYQQGRVCRDSICVIECTTQQNCATLGYPPGFTCVANRCEFPL